MALDPKRILSQIKTAPRALRILGAIVAVDLLIIFYALLSLEDDVGARAQRVGELEGQLTALKAKIQSSRKEIDSLPDLRKLYDKATTSDVLADQDRLKFVGLAQELGQQHKLSDFRFKLSPEQVSPLPGSKYQLVSTDVVLNQGAMSDGDIISFWDDFLVKSQAHYQITKAIVDFGPVSPRDALATIRSGGSPIIVKGTLEFHWQSMRRAPEAEKVSDATKVAPAGGKAAPPQPAKAGAQGQ